jgi:hypothetical protein
MQMRPTLRSGDTVWCVASAVPSIGFGHGMPCPFYNGVGSVK